MKKVTNNPNAVSLFHYVAPESCEINVRARATICQTSLYGDGGHAGNYDSDNDLDCGAF